MLLSLLILLPLPCLVSAECGCGCPALPDTPDPSHPKRVYIPNPFVEPYHPDRIRLSIPDVLYMNASLIPGAGDGIFGASSKPIPVGTIFGPYEGIRTNNSALATSGGRAWRIGDDLWMDAQNPYFANWLVKVNSYASSGKERNLDSFQHGLDIYYEVIREIHQGEELLISYGASYDGQLAGYSNGEGCTGHQHQQQQQRKQRQSTHCCVGIRNYYQWMVYPCAKSEEQQA